MSRALEGLFLPMGEALKELRARRADAGLLRRVLEWPLPPPLGGMRTEPGLMMVRSVFSADLEMERFVSLAAGLGFRPWCLEMPGDRFVSFNADKHCRGKLVFRWGQHLRSLRIMDFGRYDGRRIKDIRTLSGLPLVEYHRRLLEVAAVTGQVRFADVTEWMCGGRSRWAGYEQLLMLAVRDGILVENFRASDAEEQRLVVERVMPAVAEVKRRLGVPPLVVRLYAPQEEDDPSCWQYPGGLYAAARGLLRTGGEA